MDDDDELLEAGEPLDLEEEEEEDVEAGEPLDFDSVVLPTDDDDAAVSDEAADWLPGGPAARA